MHSVGPALHMLQWLPEDRLSARDALKHERLANERGPDLWRLLEPESFARSIEPTVII